MLNQKKLDTIVLNMLENQKILWSGSVYMNASHTADLSEPISAQNKGIVLVWSGYVNGTVQNYDYNYVFIPKEHITDRAGTGVGMVLASAGFDFVGSKYVYVSDSAITGRAENQNTGTKNGISFANNHWVLRYVIGV